MKTTENNLISYVTSECATIDREELFDAMLDDCYSFDKVGGPFACMSPSSVLKECDPIAYRCGVNDYADGEGWVEIDGDYYLGDEVESARGEFVSDLESEVEDLEGAIEEEEGEEEPDTDKLESLREKLASLREEITFAEKYTF